MKTIGTASMIHRHPTPRRPFIRALIIFALFAIGAPATATSGELLNPQPPEILPSFFDSEATAMLEMLLPGPADLNTLSLLSARYEETGFYASSQLFGASSRILCGAVPETYEIRPSPFPYDCNRVVRISADKRSPPDAGERRRVARDAARSSILKGPADPDGLNIIERAIANNGPTCELFAEWSARVLRLSIHNEGWADRGRQELAIRLLTSLASNRVYPTNYINPGHVYLLLARFFASQGDFVTALASAKTAAYYAKSHMTSGWVDPSSLERIIEEAIAGLEAEVSSDSSNLEIKCP